MSKSCSVCDIGTDRTWFGIATCDPCIRFYSRHKTQPESSCGNTVVCSDIRSCMSCRLSKSKRIFGGTVRTKKRGGAVQKRPSIKNEVIPPKIEPSMAEKPVRNKSAENTINNYPTAMVRQTPATDVALFQVPLPPPPTQPARKRVGNQSCRFRYAKEGRHHFFDAASFLSPSHELIYETTPIATVDQTHESWQTLGILVTSGCRLGQAYERLGILNGPAHSPTPFEAMLDVHQYVNHSHNFVIKYSHQIQKLSTICVADRNKMLLNAFMLMSCYARSELALPHHHNHQKTVGVEWLSFHNSRIDNALGAVQLNSDERTFMTTLCILDCCADLDLIDSQAVTECGMHFEMAFYEMIKRIYGDAAFIPRYRQLCLLRKSLVAINHDMKADFGRCKVVHEVLDAEPHGVFAFLSGIERNDANRISINDLLASFV